jgi:acylphosphatase
LIESHHILFFGIVQGVGFRWTFRKYALEAGINGWVQNLSDGSVEAVLQGEILIVNELLSLIQLNPGSIRIKSIHHGKVSLPKVQGFSVK